MDAFVREEIEPLDFIIGHPNDFTDPNREKLIPPLQAEVKRRGLWACHLGPDLGGQGYGQLKLGLMNEILGRAKCAPVVFGCQAPGAGVGEVRGPDRTGGGGRLTGDPASRACDLRDQAASRPPVSAQSRNVPFLQS